MSEKRLKNYVEKLCKALIRLDLQLVENKISTTQKCRRFNENLRF